MDSSEPIGSAVLEIKKKQFFLLDMDGVIYHGTRLLEGVKEFIQWLQRVCSKLLSFRQGKQAFSLYHQCQRQDPRPPETKTLTTGNRRG